MIVALNTKYIRCALVRKYISHQHFAQRPFHAISHVEFTNAPFFQVFQQHFFAFTDIHKNPIFDQVDVVCMMPILAWGYSRDKKSVIQKKLAQNIDPRAYISENPECESQEPKTAWSETKWGGWVLVGVWFPEYD